VAGYKSELLDDVRASSGLMVPVQPHYSASKVTRSTVSPSGAKNQQQTLSKQIKYDRAETSIIAFISRSGLLQHFKAGALSLTLNLSPVPPHIGQHIFGLQFRSSIYPCMRGMVDKFLVLLRLETWT